MKNLDQMKQEKDKLRGALAEAIRTGDEQQISTAMDGWMQFVSDTVMQEASGMIAATDRNILAARGIRQLTGEETKFYESFIANARQDAQTVITNITGDLPQTVIDSVMEDMKAAYPLLDLIDFVNTGAAIKWVLNAQGAQAAAWGELNEAITKDLAGAIQIVDMTQRKLTAYMFTTQDMLALGPQWVDRYVRAVLADSMSAGLETGMVDGNGLKTPIGMTRAFTGSLNPSTGYARKSATSVATLDPTTYGSLLAALAVDGNTSKPRAVSRVVLIVNPADYFTKVMPATTILTPMGTYVGGVLPFPTDIVQSVGVPSGHAVLGIAKKYFMGVGTGKGGKLEYSDEYKFLEDLRTYKVKFYGMGRPYDINAFQYLDISNLAPAAPSVIVSGDINNTPQTD
jgi:HK97 family phage major capsid protein